MEKLLQWSIAQQSGDKDAQEKIGQPDAKMLSQLFGGPDEPTLMKQSVMVMESPEATDEHKEVAMENFEMLIENLDNANNIENMKLWPSIINQLFSANQTFQVLAASIIAIATQNNPSSQDAFAKQDKGLEKLIELAADASTPKELRAKATFAIASLIRNNEDAASKFVGYNGLSCLSLKESSSDTKLLLRQLSLLSAVLSTGSATGRSEQIHSLHIADGLISVLDPSHQVSCIEKALHTITQLKQLSFEFSNAEIQLLKQQLSAIEPLADQLPEDDLKSVKEITA